MKDFAVSNQNAPNIIIVDDITANLKVLGDILKHDGYKVRPVPNGSLALQVAEKEKPDLILLDIMMPDMDGFEVCRRLKESKNLCNVPIIFISALNDSSDIVKALKAGGVDYITKPFKAEEVSARVATHIKLSQQTIELAELNAEKDKFFSIIAHDIRGPFNGFLGLTEILVESLPYMKTKEILDIAVSMKSSANNLYSLIENLLEWSRMQRGITSFTPELIILKQKISECTAIIKETADRKEITICYDIQDGLVVFADPNMVAATLRNLLSNAVKFTKKGGKITIMAHLLPDSFVKVSIVDTGVGMKQSMVDNLFKINVNTSRPGTEDEPSTGLGLFLCKDFVEKHGGKIRVESTEGEGSVFSFTLPAGG